MRDVQSSRSTPRLDAVAASGPSATARNRRDATTIMTTAPPDSAAYVRPSRRTRKSSYIDYDLSTMTDTKGGFLSTADDPHNKALNSGLAADGQQKPAHMTLAEWQRHRLLERLRATKTGPCEPGPSVRTGRSNGGDHDDDGRCRECGSREFDSTWRAVFGVAVCSACKQRLPERYSLLTKSEARQDYLLTEPELRDHDLLPRLEKPNPRGASFANMQLFLRAQLEDYAFSARKWHSPDALDAEFARREADKKVRKEKKFKSKLENLKKRTRVEAYRRSGQAAAAVRDGISLGSSTARFGDTVSGRFDRHEHDWGRPVEDAVTGLTKKRCVECGMEVEELEF